MTSRRKKLYTRMVINVWLYNEKNILRGIVRRIRDKAERFALRINEQETSYMITGDTK